MVVPVGTDSCNQGAFDCGKIKTAGDAFVPRSERADSLRPFVGMTQIRFKGSKLWLPLSPAHGLPQRLYEDYTMIIVRCQFMNYSA